MILDAIESEVIKLRVSILSRFPLEPLPARDELVDHQCDECWQLRDDFIGWRWLDVPRTKIDSHFNDLPLFTAVAHRYYLPAYMLRALDPTGDNWNTALDFVIYAFCPGLEEWWTERFEIFSDEQLRVAASWLKLVLEHQDLFEGDEVVGRPGYEQFWMRYSA